MWNSSWKTSALSETTDGCFELHRALFVTSFYFSKLIHRYFNRKQYRYLGMILRNEFQFGAENSILIFAVRCTALRPSFLQVRQASQHTPKQRKTRKKQRDFRTIQFMVFTCSTWFHIVCIKLSSLIQAVETYLKYWITRSFEGNVGWFERK